MRLLPRRSVLIVLWMLSSFVILHSSFLLANEPRYPFRTDSANVQLPWYQPKPLEFPPHHSAHRISGELVRADFILRTGQFRMSETGELVDFTMPPYGSINYLNAEADLRDVPLGTFFLFFLYRDARGDFTRLATMQDQFTMDADESFSYRLDEVKLGEGKLLTTKRSIPKKLDDLGKKELIVTQETRVWKGDKPVKLDGLKPGDELLYNLTGMTADNPGHCTDIWVGADTHQLATENQRKKFAEFTKKRGLPGWIDKTEGNHLTITLFSGDAQNFEKAWMDDFAVGKALSVAVANDELRTWQPAGDRQSGPLIEIQKSSVDCYGSSGVRLVVTVANMLEGFRKGRVVRIFGSGWPIKDQFFGESLMNFDFAFADTLSRPPAELMECTAKDYPAKFPFRTDYGNDPLPWYQLKPGMVPPPFSEHLVFGELVKADAEKHTGQFRTDRSDERVDFTLIPEGTVKYLNADAKLSDIAPGTRCRFHLYQDEKGAFTKASLVSDEFSFLATNAITYRIEALKLGEGKLHVARQIPAAKNSDGDMVPTPDIARTELRVGSETRVWKGDRQVKLNDLVKDDVLLINLTGELPDKHSRCTDIWVGAATHKLATEQFGKMHPTTKK